MHSVLFAHSVDRQWLDHLEGAAAGSSPAAPPAAPRDGAEPMAFDAFCVAVDGKPLTPRQKRAFEAPGALRAGDLFHPGRKVMEWVLLYGKGSGKDYLSAKFIAYLAYLVLHLAPDPAAFFGLAPGTPLAVLNVAPSQALARQVFFRYLQQFVGSAPFAGFAVEILSDEIRFPRANLTLFSKHSDPATLDGYNLLGWVMDEADAFADGADGSVAEDVHNILRSSCNTRLRGRWMGIVISYPRVEEGFMMRLFGRALGDPTFFADRAATWEVRPDVSREDPGIASDYAHDPRDAAARYECLPMSMVDAFFDDPGRIAEAVDAGRTPVAVVRESLLTCDPAGGSTREYVGGRLESVERRPGARYFMGVDAAVSGDALALCVFSVDGSTDAPEWICLGCANERPDLLGRARYRECGSREPGVDAVPYCGYCYASALDDVRTTFLGGAVHRWWRRVPAEEEAAVGAAPLVIDGTPYPVPVLREELLLAFHPRPATRPGMSPRVVDLPGVRALCKDLITALRIEAVRFDPWNAAAMVQDLQRETCASVDTISFGGPDQLRRARLVKALLYSGRLRLLPDERRDREWRRLQLKGMRVDHPKGVGESKDLFDAEAVAIWLAATSVCTTLELGFLAAEGR